MRFELRLAVLAIGLLGVLQFAAGQEAAGPPPPAADGDQGEPFRARLERFDKDGDGQLNDAERTAMREALRRQFLQGGENLRQELLKDFDQDGDGQLNDDEQLAATREMVGHLRRVGGEDFLKRFDTDGDGQLSDAELRAAGEQLRQRMGQQRGAGRGRGAVTRWLQNRGGTLDPLDLDGDGQVSDAERQRAADELATRFFGIR